MKEDIAFIKSLLYAYRQNKSELNEMIKAKESLEEQIKYYRQETHDTKDDFIEACGLKASVLSHIPRSITNKFSSITENIALNYQDQMKHKPYDLTPLAQAWIEIKQRINALNDDLQLSDNLIETLDARKKFVIRHKYILGHTMAEVTILHNETFPIPKEKRSIEDLKSMAEREMARWYMRIKK